MPATLQVVDVGAAHGARQLFTDLSVTIAPGDVWGLVGANGAGKSTLLAALAGQPGSAEMSGRTILSPPDATVGHLAQEPERLAGEDVRTFVHRRTGVAAAATEMESAAEAMASDPGSAAGGPSVADRYTAALDRWLALGGGDLDDRLPAAAADLGLQVPLDAHLTTLSGGEAARVGLLALLLQRYDVVLLDEPTNDLDLAGLERLETFVHQSRSPLVIVSHDREFLARCVTGIIELDLAQRQISVFDGGYEAFLAERAIARSRARGAYDAYADRLGALQQRAQMQKQWVDKGVRNARKKARDSDKSIIAAKAARSEKQAAKVSQSERAIERLEVVEEPRKEWQLQLSIAQAPRSGTVVATLDAATVHHGDFTLGPVTAQVDAGDRIVITGANGSGKTTLLGLLLGRTPPAGGRASLGSGVEIGEVDQARTLFEVPDPLPRAFGRLVPDLSEADVRTLLAKFGLGGEHATRSADSLSPGERTRATLALLQARGVNLLVLDEPTNHLDLPAIEQLEQAVESFDGTLLLVTHDRRMLDTVRATRRWRMEQGQLTELDASPT
ncbi:ATP-binding cassette domain-containing protein [Ornithinimicrobium faecis]|uniref:ATP-binding cassette domain-containing protein n=1 Tax=Ornithinimicrobium faecis TaxID=2934158 RepID=A0ABY4YVD1_9MICO|nr:ABC-F family ATP-binding cassette domain-containing protein [Ornithinimicrobium sp. HY1793]USQ80678.1 ATP-binding cassette domain-containing protein [Ornithinimicrobium sp. HY1793]